MEIGTTLQQARISKGFTLAHISDVTKMSSHVLQLIEANDFERLPGGLLTRGYLRAFAREVGLNPEKIVSEYRAEFERGSVEDEPFHLPASYHDTKSNAPYAGVMLIIGLALLMYFVYPRPTQRSSELGIDADTVEVNVDEATAISAAVAASARSAPIPTPRIAPADSEGLQVELHPQRECWVSATADGRLVIYRLMRAGERETIHARDEILLRIGDAGALRYFVNGAVGRSLGASGQAVSVRMTNDNWATWLTNEGRHPL